MLRIRDLTASDIPSLKDFAPREWNVDLSVTFGRHFGQPHFYPIVAEQDGALVGCANGLLQGRVGWLGNIIVQPEYRGHGIGSALTEEVMKFLHTKNMEYQILIATSMGEPIYRRLGFQVVSYYIFFARQHKPPSSDVAAGIRPLERNDKDAIFALDKSITGEKRDAFLRLYLKGACVYADPSGGVDGFYLPALGTGLIAAADDAAGLALLHYKITHGGTACVVPEQSRVVVDYLRSHGFAETSRALRMALGSDIAWQPEHVYSRGSGFCG